MKSAKHEKRSPERSPSSVDYEKADLTEMESGTVVLRGWGVERTEFGERLIGELDKNKKLWHIYTYMHIYTYIHIYQ